jgi:hypothetical protein
MLEKSYFLEKRPNQGQSLGPLRHYATKYQQAGLMMAGK